MNTNHIKHLKSFILSPIFPVLLGLTIFIVCLIYFTPFSLCDDILDMKDKLDFEIWKLEDNRIKMNITKKNFDNLDLITSKNTNGGFIARKVWRSQLEKFYNDEILYLKNIRNIESWIKNVEPDFSTKVDLNWKFKWERMLKRN